MDLLVLTPELRALREELERVLFAVPEVVFVSVGFSATDTGAVLVSLGTGRPDLLQVRAEELATLILRTLYACDSRAWNPAIQILKGRIKG
jgi:hypothetical protein